MQQQHYAYSSWTWRDFRLRSATLSAPSWTYIMLMPSVYKKPMSTLMWQTVFLSLALISSASTYIPSMVELCMLVRTWQVLLTSFQQLTATLSRLVLSLLPMSTVLLANHGQNTTCFHPFHIPRSMWVTLTARCRGWEQWFAAGPWFKAKGTFVSARRQCEYSPDLCRVSSICGHPQPAPEQIRRHSTVLLQYQNATFYYFMRKNTFKNQFLRKLLLTYLSPFSWCRRS